MIAALLGFSLVACHHQPPSSVSNGILATAGGHLPGDTTQAQAVAALNENFAKVHFATDSSTLDAAGRAALEENARILEEHPELRVEVQGHADERGTVDYNLALGQRRAEAVVSYLVGQGVSSNRLPILSYGEERPAATGANEVAYAENRRAEFRVLTGAPGVEGTTTY
jgi:peptidoglycan-associated lipoprotein